MPDEVTFIQMFHAYENSLKGRELHASITNNTRAMIETALVCMYGKIGNLDDARRVFDNMCSRDLVCWTAMIMAYVEKGENRNALRLFQLLKKENIKPDVVSFVGVLTACANLTSLDGCFSFSDDLETLEKVVNLLAYISHKDLFAYF